MNHFSELAVFEIKEAYELWAAGIIEVPGGEMYGGVFSVKQLGKVLSAYKDYRRQISALIINAEHHEKERIALEKKKKRRKKEFEENFPLLLKKAKIKYRTWRDVPVWYYQVAMKRKMIQFTEGEADQILEEAKEAVRVEITSEQEKTMKSFKELAILRQLIDNQEERAKTYARQLTVWKKITIMSLILSIAFYFGSLHSVKKMRSAHNDQSATKWLTFTILTVLLSVVFLSFFFIQSFLFIYKNFETWA